MELEIKMNQLKKEYEELERRTFILETKLTYLIRQIKEVKEIGCDFLDRLRGNCKT